MVLICTIWLLVILNFLGIASGNIQQSDTYLNRISGLTSQLITRNSNQTIVLKRSSANSHCVRVQDYKQQGFLQLDISCFTNLLSLDTVSPSRLPNELQKLYDGFQYVGVARVEAMMTMEQLVDDLLPSGFIPACVPEFKGITAGGSVQGLAAESTSFHFGFFHDTVIAFDLLLADGRLIRCSRNENSELFYGVPGTYGTVGIITAMEIVCIPATPTITLSIERFADCTDCINCLKSIVEASIDGRLKGRDYQFAEGLSYSKTSAVAITGHFTPAINPAASNFIKHISCSQWGDHWFYNIIRDLPDGSTVTINTKDYLFRHDRGAFWMASFRIPQFIGRLLGSLLDSSNMFKLSTMLPWAFPKKTIVLQDCMLPAANNRAANFLSKAEDLLDLYPVWLLPMVNLAEGEPADRQPIFGLSANAGRIMCNIGLYGIPRKRFYFIKHNRALEDILIQQDGRKVFYSVSMMSEVELYEQLYDGQRYHQLRKRVGAEGAFPPLHQKILFKRKDRSKQ